MTTTVLEREPLITRYVGPGGKVMFQINAPFSRDFVTLTEEQAARAASAILQDLRDRQNR